MIFTDEHCQKILSGQKTEAFFPAMPGDSLGTCWGFPAVRDARRKLKYVVSGLYAVQTGPGKKGLGWIEITGIERRENPDEWRLTFRVTQERRRR